MVSELYGLPLANASLYDGASATAEGVLMARRLTKKNGVVMSECVHPHYRETTEAYLEGSAAGAITRVGVDESGGANVKALIEAVTDDTACVVVGSPSYLGTLTQFSQLVEACHARDILIVASVVEPYALALVEPPGKWGADIVVGEG